MTAARAAGSDSRGQLGDDATLANKSSPVAVALPAGRAAVAISADLAHTCALLDDGGASCWGRDANGQLGDDATLADKPTPVTVALPSGRTAVAISAGTDHTCAVIDDGGARCWGFDGDGQLGDDATLANQSTPVAVALPASRRAVAISAGVGHTCALLDDGGASCWGFDGNGQLGDDAPLAQKPIPVTVALPAGSKAVAISASGNHTCAILDDGSASCWGLDNVGQLGDDATLANKSTPVVVALPAGRTAIAISAGSSHTCALLDDGSASCWGLDNVGQLGDDATLANKSTPVVVALPAGRTAVAISAGSSHTCALLDDGGAGCWGFDGSGQLGNGLDATQQPVAAVAPSALAASSSVGRVADVSVVLEGAPAGLGVGASGTVVVRVSNAGPDAASGLRVQLQPALVGVATGVVGQGGVADGYWDVGTLAPGAATTLSLTLTGLSAGAGSLTVQVAAQVEADSDSTPANGAAGEDDQATAPIAITAPPNPPQAPALGRAAVDRLTLVLSAGRDTSPPHATRAGGRLVAASVAALVGCVGTVTLTGKAGTKTLLTRNAKLKLVDGACEYAASLAVSAKQRGRTKRLTIKAGFRGNDALLAASSRPRTFRLG